VTRVADDAAAEQHAGPLVLLTFTTAPPSRGARIRCASGPHHKPLFSLFPLLGEYQNHDLRNVVTPHPDLHDGHGRRFARQEPQAHKRLFYSQDFRNLPGVAAPPFG